ncbi:MAG: hypothetical protein IT435_02645 [Phycisphaerales bacterium]|nr:hypothetical protein [Phycisphaerales bacterium]
MREQADIKRTSDDFIGKRTSVIVHSSGQSTIRSIAVTQFPQFTGFELPDSSDDIKLTQLMTKYGADRLALALAQSLERGRAVTDLHNHPALDDAVSAMLGTARIIALGTHMRLNIPIHRDTVAVMRRIDSTPARS